MIEWFINKFMGTPELYWNDYPIEFIIRCLSFHFLSSAFAGLLFYWILTTLLQRYSEWPDRSISRVALYWSVSVALLVHLSVDAFTRIA